MTKDQLIVENNELKRELNDLTLKVTPWLPFIDVLDHLIALRLNDIELRLQDLEYHSRQSRDLDG